MTLLNDTENAEKINLLDYVKPSAKKLVELLKNCGKKLPIQALYRLYRRNKDSEKLADKESKSKKYKEQGQKAEIKKKTLEIDVKQVEAKVQDPRQKRYNLNQKAEFIGYMSRREEEEERSSNVSRYAEQHGVSRPTLYNLICFTSNAILPNFSDIWNL